MKYGLERLGKNNRTIHVHMIITIEVVTFMEIGMKMILVVMMMMMMMIDFILTRLPRQLKVDFHERRV